MRVLILSSHPLVDRASHKGAVLRALRADGIDVTVLYGGTRWRDYAYEVRRRRPSDMAAALLPRTPATTDAQVIVAGAPLRAVARAATVRVFSVPSLATSEAASVVDHLEPDLTFNLSALYIPTPFLGATGNRVVGAHYAELPRIRGSDAIRWSVLLDAPLRVSHQVLTPEFDMGDIVHTGIVDVVQGDDIRTLRRKCQQASVVGYLAVARAFRSGTLERLPQRRADGSTFSRMGSYLRAEVDEILRDNRYSHYASV